MNTVPKVSGGVSALTGHRQAGFDIRNTTYFAEEKLLAVDC